MSLNLKAITKEGNTIDVFSIEFMNDGTYIVNEEVPIAPDNLIIDYKKNIPCPNCATELTTAYDETWLGDIIRHMYCKNCGRTVILVCCHPHAQYNVTRTSKSRELQDSRRLF